MNLIIDEWTNDDYESLYNYLYLIRDEKYKELNDKICCQRKISIGIKMPFLNDISKEIMKGNYISYLDNCKFKIYEFTIIYIYILCKIKEYDISTKYLNKVLKHLDSWALTDQFCHYKIVLKYPNEFLLLIKKLINDKNEFIIRLGIILLMNFYINDKYINQLFNYISKIRSELYYVNMALAWILSFTYIKYKEKTLEFIKKVDYCYFVKYKAYCKILESTRVNMNEKIKVKELRSKLIKE